MNARGVLAVLELAASDGPPGLVEPLAAYLRRAPGAVDLARSWGVQPGEIAEVVALAVQRLDWLERRRRPGRLTAADVGGQALLWPVVDIIRARAERLSAIRRRLRLEALGRRLEPLAKETTRTWLERFLTEDGSPVDVAKVLGRG